MEEEELVALEGVDGMGGRDAGSGGQYEAASA